MQNSIISYSASFSQSNLIQSLFWHFPRTLISWASFNLLSVIIVVLVAVYMFPKEFKEKRIRIFIGLMIGVYFTFIGAKIFYFIINGIYSLLNRETFDISTVHLGKASLGLFFFQLLVTWVLTKNNKNGITFLKALDYFVAVTFAGLALTRIECLCVGCCYGRPLAGPIGALFNGNHPTQIYSFVNLCFSLVVSRILYIKRRNFPDGSTYFGSMAVYCALRVIIEGFRADSVPVLGSITLAQITFLLMAAGSIFALVRINKRSAV
ncbi:MAG: prolipoprotein diacylglyceryl transferase [Candidatus Aadella gelida]|nr:prolipoprotein diacylglyceryl transferase [Candidatus Aadella gelida]